MARSAIDCVLAGKWRDGVGGGNGQGMHSYSDDQDRHRQSDNDCAHGASNQTSTIFMPGRGRVRTHPYYTLTVRCRRIRSETLGVRAMRMAATEPRYADGRWEVIQSFAEKWAQPAEGSAKTSGWTTGEHYSGYFASMTLRNPPRAANSPVTLAHVGRQARTTSWRMRLTAFS